MATLTRNLENREWLFERLKAEVVGPDPSGKPFEKDVVANNFYTWEQYRGPKHQKNGEEILWQDPPIKRYGAGILFPHGLTELDQLANDTDSTSSDFVDEVDVDNLIDEKLEKNAEKKAAKVGQGRDELAEEDVSLANAYRPSAMGLSFFADLSKVDEELIVTPSFGTYKKIEVRAGESIEANQFTKRHFWCRIKGQGPEGKELNVFFSKKELLGNIQPIKKWVPGYEDKLEIVVLVRESKNCPSTDQKLLTISIVNRQKAEKDKGLDELCFFQSGFTIASDNNSSWISPYPEIIREHCTSEDEEEIIRLLYREHLTFAIGHGCSADWDKGRPQEICKIWTECLPRYETTATSADLTDEHGRPLRVSMRKLAALDPEDDGTHEIEALVSAYERWISALRDTDTHLPQIPEDLKATADHLINKCRLCANRIRKGLDYLKSDKKGAETARQAFKLANHAMLIAQLRSSRDVRTPVNGDGRLEYDKPIQNPDSTVAHEYKGYWRAFQIAFLLMSIPGICHPDDEDREIVDLIWFPTGGGKTEAYLGLTAFTIFYNRLSGRNPGGADVLMRYTLRLLTAQQFQRAALLFCAMEFLRRAKLSLLGETPFRLGMWVGGSATPNTRDQAKSALKQLQRDPEAENPFVLLKCPWCNALFGPLANHGDSKKKTKGKSRNVLGYELYRKPEGGPDTVVFRCDDPACEFGKHPAKPKPPLPIIIIDEDLFDNPPNLIIGTVDKFAMLAWKPEARSIFGIGSDGRHVGMPPSLIIQDELHLISGPLGSMVGIYETLIDELCTLREGGKIFRPKIVASTATISRAEEQVRALYAREQVALFPPSGLEAGDSFFAREDKSSNGTLKPGRLYVGIMAPGHGSLQTTVARIFASLLQNPAIMPVADNDESERDPWWTLLCFFNSLRELGGAATLLVSDARDYLRVIIDRHGFPYDQIRQLLNVEELTSRIRSDYIPRAIQKLEKPFLRNEKGFVNDTVEVCLASNIIEVGVDIDRLSLMSIVGQPKTTSQYIQVSSRVGRNPSTPGLVTILYSQSKPRDRSHFERFRMYHQRLYAQVEPTSVTPFSPPAVERALHAVLVAVVRQLGDSEISASPRPFPLQEGSILHDYIIRIFERRAAFVDKEELENVRKMLRKRLDQWRGWNPSDYGSFSSPGEDPTLMHPAGSDVPVTWGGRSWPVMSSLRNVDASCEAEITSHYNQLHVHEEGEI